MSRYVWVPRRVRGQFGRRYDLYCRLGQEWSRPGHIDEWCRTAGVVEEKEPGRWVAVVEPFRLHDLRETFDFATCHEAQAALLALVRLRGAGNGTVGRG